MLNDITNKRTKTKTMKTINWNEDYELTRKGRATLTRNLKVAMKAVKNIDKFFKRDFKDDDSTLPVEQELLDIAEQYGIKV
jgi:DNA-binding PadR family transcriptional regulator